jgi:hypothetical protein
MASKKATPHDAQLILQLYDLRREPVMRKARDFMMAGFWPVDYSEVKALIGAFGTEQNAYARQVTGYWEMAAAMVLDGAINEDLFFKSNGEPYFLYAKFKSFIPAVRKDFNAPEYMLNVEKLANKSPQAKERVKRIEANLKARAEQLRSAAKAGK